MSEESYLNTLKQIEELKQRAEALKNEEISPTIERFKRAIQVYGIKPSDVFSPEELNQNLNPASASGASSGLKPPKYFSGKGESWSGFGRKPNWFIAAVSQGRSLESMLTPGEATGTNDAASETMGASQAASQSEEDLISKRNAGALLLNEKRMARQEAKKDKPKKDPKAPQVRIEGKGYSLGERYWTGVGPRPKWFKEAIASGTRIDEMRA